MDPNPAYKIIVHTSGVVNIRVIYTKIDSNVELDINIR